VGAQGAAGGQFAGWSAGGPTVILRITHGTRNLSKTKGKQKIATLGSSGVLRAPGRAGSGGGAAVGGNAGARARTPVRPAFRRVHDTDTVGGPHLRTAAGETQTG